MVITISSRALYISDSHFLTFIVCETCKSSSQLQEQSATAESWKAYLNRRAKWPCVAHMRQISNWAHSKKNSAKQILYFQLLSSHYPRRGFSLVCPTDLLLLSDNSRTNIEMNQVFIKIQSQAKFWVNN